MNIEKIRTHMNCGILLRTECLNENFTKHCTDTILESNLNKIHSHGIGDKIRFMKYKVLESLLNSEELLDPIIILLENGVDSNHIEILLNLVPEEEILHYSVDALDRVLKDTDIPYKYLNVYLRHYMDLELTQEQKKTLSEALDNYFKNYKGEKDLIKENQMFFCSRSIASRILNGIKNYDECLETLVKRKDLCHVLEQILVIMKENIEIDDDIFFQLKENAKEIGECLQWCCSFFSPEEIEKYCSLWLRNHALHHDLKQLRQKVKGGQGNEAKQIIKGRMSYIAFFYNTCMQPEWEGAEREDLLVYAVVNKKRSFLTLIRENADIFKSLPRNSVLFCQSFFKHIVNINALNQKNLAKCRRMLDNSQTSRKVIQILLETGQVYTFQEVEVLYEMPIFYTQLYCRLKIPRVDDKIRVIREVKNANCLTRETNIEGLAEMLSICPLSKWMQNEFLHIKDMDVVVSLLQSYQKVKHLIPEVTAVGEARYLAQNADVVMKETSMANVRKNILHTNPEWKSLCKELELSNEFVEENQERIREFIYDDGPYVLLQYYKDNTEKKEELRRLAVAEFMGRFRELKYYKDDLSRELDYPITVDESSIWEENLEIYHKEFFLREEDGLLPIMRMGEIPVETCLSYKDGEYNNCLLACHDANKKVLYLSYNGKIVLRAAIRLTKGAYSDLGKYCGQRLEFADLSADNSIEQEAKEQNERIVLLLERPYYANLPKVEEKTAVELILQLMKRKAEQMKAILVLSMDYRKWMPQGFVSSRFFMYISKSKAGAQYLDSLKGSYCISDEGTYEEHSFLICVNN